MRTSVVATIIFLGALASRALGADFSIKGSVNQTLDGGNNYFMLPTPSGATARSLTASTLDFLAQTPTTRYLLNTNYSYFKYFGPGAADIPLTWGRPASATFSIDHADALTKYNFLASWTRSDVSTTNFAQTGVASGTGTVDTYNVGGGISRDLSRTDTLSWTINGSTVSYTDQSQTPYIDLVTGLNWNHDLNQTTSLINSVTMDWFSLDNPAKSERLYWKLLTGLQSKLSSRLTFSGDVGLGFANAWQNGSAQPVAAIVPPIVPPGFPVVPPFQPQAGTGHSFLADIGLTYDLLKSTKVSLTASQSISPLLTGQLQKADSVGLTVNYTVNDVSNLSFATSFVHIPPSPSGGSFGSGQSSSSDFFSAGVTYGYQFAREWRSTVSYTYLDSPTANTNTSVILVSLTRDFTLMGNPTAINQAEAERARQRQRNSVGYVFPNIR